MSETVTERPEPVAFAEKNAARRGCRGQVGSLKRREYNAARSLRRAYAAGGAFGRLKTAVYNKLVVGTTGIARLAEDGGEAS